MMVVQPVTREHVSKKIIALPNTYELAVPTYEDAVCSCVLRDDTTYPMLADILMPHDFTQKINIYVWKCFEDMAMAGTPIDRETVLTQLGTYEQLIMEFPTDHLRKWLLSILPSAPDTKNALAYAKIVRERAQRIRGVESALNIATILRDTRIDHETAWDKAQGEWNKANEQTVLSPTDMNAVSNAFVQELMSSEGHMIKTGFTPLDELGTTKRKRITVLAGSSGQGKSQFTLSLTRSLCTLPELERTHIAYFSFEMPRNEIMQNFISFETRINRKRLDEKRLSPDDLKHILEAVGKAHEWGMDIFDSTDVDPTIEAIWRRVRNLKMTKDVGFVVIDGLWHLQHDSATDASRYQYNAMKIKQMASALNCHVWVCHQYNSGGMHLKEDDEPMIYHVDGGSMAVRDFDNVLMLKRSNNPSRPTRIFIRKSRGRSGVTDAHEYHYDNDSEMYSPFAEAKAFGEAMANVPF